MNLIKNIAAIIISFVLVLAIGGVTVFQHYCNCEQLSSVSVFIDESCCDHQSEAASGCCETSNQKSCCETQHKDHSCSKEGKDCCSTYTEFFKISNPVNIPVKSNIVISYTHLFTGILYYQTFTASLFSHSPLLLCSDTSPPVTEAKSLLITHHQLKLAPDHLS